ncbi:hypothetical protein [Pseudarthrobacter sp. N5]|uniref:hypothetical protein n=1 Tax=Pseudarthrobacter sp. N5 TaxID=3418416 RepID=UPI003CEE7EF9
MAKAYGSLEVAAPLLLAASDLKDAAIYDQRQRNRKHLECITLLGLVLGGSAVADTSWTLSTSDAPRLQGTK